MVPAQVVSSINNLIIGKLYVDHGGTMRVASSASGLVCRLKFREQGVLRMREAHEVLLPARTRRPACTLIIWPCLHAHLRSQTLCHALPTSLPYKVLHAGMCRLSGSQAGLLLGTMPVSVRVAGLESGMLPNAQVKGHLENAQGERLPGPLLLGKWDEGMWAQLPDGSQRLLWQKAPPPPNPTRCAWLLLCHQFPFSHDISSVHVAGCDRESRTAYLPHDPQLLFRMDNLHIRTAISLDLKATFRLKGTYMT